MPVEDSKEKASQPSEILYGSTGNMKKLKEIEISFGDDIYSTTT